VPGLTGAIMTMGGATANSILVVAFARQRLPGPRAAPPPRAPDARDAHAHGALRAPPGRGAGGSRIRPVLMTAFAMIIGMIPMALGLGEGAEQNAPLGRAVIGGGAFSHSTALFFVPTVFAGVHLWLQNRKSQWQKTNEPSA